MKLNSAFRTQKSQEWRTPEEVFRSLDNEFHFDFDPCSGSPTFDGLSASWGESNFVNPPYKEIGKWLEKAIKEERLSVFLLPVRTGTWWFHLYANLADEIRFIRGRLQFNGCGINAPFDSMIMVFNGKFHNRH